MYMVMSRPKNGAFITTKASLKSKVVITPRLAVFLVQGNTCDQTLRLLSYLQGALHSDQPDYRGFKIDVGS